MRLLIVDDSEALVQRLTSSLAEVPGLENIGSAGNVADAVRKIHEAKPDVVILDICIQGGSGIDVLEGLKHDSFQPIVIVLSNYVDRQYRRKCQQNGARFYFDKSTEFHRVAAALRDLIKVAED
jgi:DNA-binding NarL/FixJ family response regulator